MKKTDSIPINREVRQGDTLSSKLLIIALENIPKKMNWAAKGININGKYVTHLCYANNIILIAKKCTELEEMITKLNKESQKVDLTMNSTKTNKVMYNESET